MSEAIAMVITRDLSEEENYSGRAIAKGETVYEYRGCTYGCIGPDGIAVTFEPDATPFFEIPDNAVAMKASGQ